MEEEKNPVVPQGSSTTLALSKDEIEPLNMYISSVCITLLSESADDFHKAIHLDSNQNVLLKFAGDASSKILIVSKIKAPISQDAAATSTKTTTATQNTSSIRFSIEIESTNVTSHSIAFVKRQSFGVIDAATGYSSTI